MQRGVNEANFQAKSILESKPFENLFVELGMPHRSDELIATHGYLSGRSKKITSKIVSQPAVGSTVAGQVGQAGGISPLTRAGKMSESTLQGTMDAASMAIKVMRGRL